MLHCGSTLRYRKKHVEEVVLFDAKEVFKSTVHNVLGGLCVGAVLFW